MNAETYRKRLPFPPLELSFDEQQHLHDLSNRLLSDTLSGYDELREAKNDPSPYHADLESTRWKRQKTQANASLYSERVSGLKGDIRLPESWENPAVLLIVGNIQGSLDDVMFGLVTPGFGDMKIRSATLGTTDVDGAMLGKLSSPTENDPFRNLNIMWLVGEQGWPLSMVVRPRDFVLLSSSGVMTRESGERIGYDVVQSLELPQCPPLSKPMVRGRLMQGAIYREKQDGTVDVYIHEYVETHGRLLDTVIMNVMWSSVLAFWDAPRFSESKKLAWCIAVGKSHGAPKQSCTQTGHWSGSPSCGICLKKLSQKKDALPNPSNTCALCFSLLCLKCRVSRSFRVLSTRSKGPSTRVMRVVVCPRCQEFVRHQSAADVAWQQQQQRMASDGYDSSSCNWEPYRFSDTMGSMWSVARSSSIPTPAYESRAGGSERRSRRARSGNCRFHN